MSTVAIEYEYPRMLSVTVTADLITAELSDGRSVSVPLAWSWRLTEATPTQRANHQLIGSGLGAHWPDVDEDVSVAGMLHGTPSTQPLLAKAA